MSDVTRTAISVMAQIAEAVEAGGGEEELVQEIVCRVGAPFELILGTGGPTVWISARLNADGERSGHAELHVTHGTDAATRWGSSIDAFTDRYVELARATA